MATNKTVRLVVESVPDYVERMLRIKAAKAGHNSLADYLRKQFSEEYKTWRDNNNQTGR